MITHHVRQSGFGVTEHEPQQIQDAIYAVETMFSQHAIPLIPAEHMFVPGLYFRRFEMAEDTYLTGKIHVQDDGLIVAQGKVTFMTGEETRTIEGPCMVTVKGGTKPLLHAHTHVVFFSAHLNLDDTRDLEIIESRVVVPNELGCKPLEVLS